MSERKAGATQLVLRESKEKIALVARAIHAAQQAPAGVLCMPLHAGVVAGGDALGADLPGGNQEIIKLQVIVAECAWNWRTAREILLHERPHHLLLKALLMV